MLAYRLTTRPRRQRFGCLVVNSFANAPQAFDDSALEIGLVLAAHASVAAHVADERSLEAVSRPAGRAADRHVIGQTKAS